MYSFLYINYSSIKLFKNKIKIYLGESLWDCKKLGNTSLLVCKKKKNHEASTDYCGFSLDLYRVGQK